MTQQLDHIEGKLARVRGEVEARQGMRPRSLNLATLYCSAEVATPPSHLSLVSPATPPASATSSFNMGSIRSQPLLPPAAKSQRSMTHQPIAGQMRRARTHSQYWRDTDEPGQRSSYGWLKHWMSELMWLLIGLRHFMLELPLLILLHLNKQHVLFYLSLAATCSPGLAALYTVLRSGVIKGSSLAHSVVRCGAICLRLESLLRLAELALWRQGSAVWRHPVAIAQAGAGSAPQLLLQVTSLGLCAHHVVAPEPDVTSTDNIAHFRGMEPLDSSSLCDPAVVVLQCLVSFMSALHVAWALTLSSKPKLPFGHTALDPGLRQLLSCTSTFTGITANLLLSGSRMALVLLAASTYHFLYVAATFLLLYVLLQTTQVIRRCMGKPWLHLALVLCSLVAVVPETTSPRILARRCVLFVAENVVMLLGIGLRTHDEETATNVYRVAVLHAASAMVGSLLMLARLRWVHVTSIAPSPAAGGKCYSRHSPQDDV